MTKSEAKRRAEQLKREIEHHRYLYHVLDKQEISDGALDSLKRELFELEQEYPELVTPDSPTQRVSGEPLEEFGKVKHQKRMLSLNDAFSREDMESWLERLERLEPGVEQEFFAETKIDGLAMSLVYEGGVLKVGATRGNGVVGEDVTHNIRTIESVPLRLRDVPAAKRSKRIEVRGEVYLSKKDFERINKERVKAGEEPFMNPRNTAAGSIRQLDPALAAERDLSFLAYALPTDLGQQTHEDEHELLRELGLKTDDDAKLCKGLDEVMAFYRAVQNKRDSLPYQIDGTVVTVNSNALFQKFGVVGKAPRGSIALKFPAEQATTIVEDIRVQVGRTGALTPVAHLKPVQVAGTTVTRATLHNEDEIKRLGVKIGDTVIVEKAGDIIPDIVQVLPKMRTGKETAFRMPKNCPVCGSAVVRREGEAASVCTNQDCYAQQVRRLQHFISKGGLDIDGLGPNIINQLLQDGLIRDAADLFELTEGDVEPLEGFAELAARNLVDAIDDASTVPLARLVYALGIRHVGEQTAVVLAERFGSLQALAQATQEQLESIHDIGPAAAESIHSYFTSAKNQKLLKRLQSHLTIQAPTATQSSNRLNRASFLFTGTLETMTRDDAKALVRKNGGTIASSVTGSLNYLVVGANPGSKVEKAKKKGITTISEQQFLDMVS